MKYSSYISLTTLRWLVSSALSFSTSLLEKRFDESPNTGDRVLFIQLIQFLRATAGILSNYGEDLSLEEQINLETQQIRDEEMGFDSSPAINGFLERTSSMGSDLMSLSEVISSIESQLDTNK